MHKELKALVKAMTKLTLERARTLKDVQPLIIEKEKKKKKKKSKDMLIIHNGEVVGRKGEGYIEGFKVWQNDKPDDCGSPPDCGSEGPEES